VNSAEHSGINSRMPRFRRNEQSPEWQYWQDPLPICIPPESTGIRQNHRNPAGISGASLRPPLWGPTTNWPSMICYLPFQHPTLLLPLPSLKDMGTPVSLSAHPTKVVDHSTQLTASQTSQQAHQACHFIDALSILAAPLPLMRQSPPVL
jgi:hypothetical protein